MSIFRRIFKSGTKPGHDQVQRAARLQMLPLHGVTFHVQEPPGFGHLAVLNLSVEGIGLMRGSDGGRANWPAPGSAGSRLRGRLMIRSEEFPLAVALVHAGADRAGGRFENPSPEFQRRLREHFLAEFAAQKMGAVKRELLQDDPDGEPRFFVGENNSELFLVEKDGRLVHFHLCFFGNVIDGEKDGTISAGTLDDRDHFASDGPGRKSVALVKRAQAVSDDLAALAVRFLSNVRGLDSGLREQIEARLRSR